MKAAILDSGYKSYDFEKNLFEEKGIQLTIFPSYDGDRNAKIEFAKDADGILVRHTKIDREFLAAMKNLKAIVRYGVGYDNIDIEACTEKGVKVANVQGYANHSVSDHALALILSCSRGMWNTKYQILNQFASPPVPDIFELHDKTIGIVGIGRIGSELCKKAKPLFNKTLAVDPYKPDSHFTELGVSKSTLEEVLQKSDVISLNCNLSDETWHLLSHTSFKMMKKKPIIINTSRGEVIDETALYDALNNEQIHSAGIDVFEDEPTTETQLKIIDHPRTICTGHYAWYSDRSALELQKRAALNLNNFLHGLDVEDCLNC